VSNDNRVGRGVPTGGEFAAKSFPDAPAALPVSEFDDIGPETSRFYTHANGDFNAAKTGFESIEVYRSGNDVEPPRALWVEASVDLDFHHLVPASHSAPGPKQWLDTRAAEIDAWIRANYDGMRIDGASWFTEDGQDWEYTILIADADLGDTEPTSFTEAVTAVKSTTGFGRFDVADGATSPFFTALGAHLAAVDDGSIPALSR
jgi:hypothetical protein